jgi:hypothetical protein
MRNDSRPDAVSDAYQDAAARRNHYFDLRS